MELAGIADFLKGRFFVSSQGKKGTRKLPKMPKH
jgi:hypothetical protein